MKQQSLHLAAQQEATIQLWTLDPAQGNAEDPPRPCIDDTTRPISPQTCYIDFPASSTLRFLQWDPQSFRLGIMDESGLNLCLRPLQPNSKSDLEMHNLTSMNDPSPSSSQPAQCCSFSRRSGRHLAIARSDGSLSIHDLRKHLTSRAQFSSDQLIQKCPSNRKHNPVCLTWALADRVVACGCDDGCIMLYLAASGAPDCDVDSFCLPHPVQVNKKPPACLILRNSSVDASLIASGYADGSIRIWQLEWPIRKHQDCLIAQWDANDFTRPIENDGLRQMDLTLSPINDQLLLSSGFPDFCLRVWNMGSPFKDPVKELVPKAKSHGYLTLDLATDSFTLATGLVNGEIWIYDLRNLSAPIYLLQGKPGIPITVLSFAPTTRFNDDVRFKDPPNSTPHSILDPPTKLKSDEGPDQPTSTQSPYRSVLSELSNNFSPDVEGQRSWNSLMREFSIPELSSLSNSSMFSIGSKPVQFTPSPQQRVAPSEPAQPSSPLLPSSSNQAMNFEVDQTLECDSRPTDSNPTTVITKPPIPNDQLADSLKQTILFRLEPLINQSHYELLFHISKLERRIDQMKSEFGEALRELKQQNESLRMELIKYCSFY